MTIDELAKAANAINKRIDNLVKQFGRSSKAVKQYETMIKANFHQEGSFSTKSGILHVSRSKKALSKVTNVEAKFQKFFEAPTVGSVKDKAVEQLKEQGINNPTKEEIMKQVELSESAEEVIKNNAYKYDLYTDSDLKYAKKTLNTRGRRKTWSEIDKIVEILKKDYNDKEIQEPKNEFEQLDGVYR